GGTPTTIASFTSIATGTRTKVTPAEALALYQVSLGTAAVPTGGLTAQTVGIIAANATVGKLTASAVNPNPPLPALTSSITVPEFDLPTFTSFVLSATDPTNVNGISLSVTGLTPVLNIKASTIKGTIDFPTASSTALIITNGNALNVQNNGVGINA